MAAGTEIAIVGGGLVGTAIGLGLVRGGASVALYDEGDVAHRAARGNLGNVWVQGKGLASPPYAELTRRAALAWRDFAAELTDETGIDLRFRQDGAFFCCFSPEELDKRAGQLEAAEARSQIPSGYARASLSDMRADFPMLGDGVAGATFCKLDGMVDPLRLLRALLAAFQKRGGRYLPRARVESIAPDAGGFRIASATGEGHADRLVLAAGLGNARLAPQLGLEAPVRPVRGQILITEKLRPFMPRGISFIRQTADGGLICGESSEEAGFEEATTRNVLQDTARRATAVFPFLRDVRAVRAWGALRVMSPDGQPIYQRSASHPQAFLTSVHSGVTLAPFHAGPLADAIRSGALPDDIALPFSPARFHVQATRAA
ncbi:MAG: FAD-dependent oxidoreductase [Methylobacterium sp.]|nr:FAD-dependent oxidoreductase [Methylobacterium sp.]